MAFTTGLLVVIAVLFHVYSTGAAGPISVPWSEQYYGPDGPWQAVRVIIQNPGHYVDLIPSTANYEGFGAAYLLMNDTFCNNRGYDWVGYCGHSSVFSCFKRSTQLDDLCGRGGTFNTSADKYDDSQYSVPWSQDMKLPEINRTSEGMIWIGPLKVAGAQSSHEVWSSALWSDHVISPGGVKYRPQTGTLMVDAYRDATPMIRTLGHNGSVYTQGCTFLSCLKDNDDTQTISFGMHYGSASLNFNGSLIAGGYDQGRIIGKSAKVDGDTVQLLDVSLGVEAGGSPFAQGFKLKSGFVATTTLTKVDSLMPGLHLPGDACSALASQLPVADYRNDIGYYLWKVNDPTYARLMNSPAYMSFTFPPAPANADGANVTIKVALRLLNLTLDTPIINSPTSYFPCFKANGTTAYLGKAFLQAAFTGRNFHSSASWLTQAPGPGRDKNGLGVMLKELEAKDVDVRGAQADNEEGAWMKSWEDYLKPLPEPSSNEDPNDPNDPKDVEPNHSTSASHGPSAGTISGIVSGIVVLIVIAIGGLIWWILRRKSTRSDGCEHGCPDGEHVLGCPRFAHPDVVELGPSDPESSTHKSLVKTTELPGSNEVFEMPVDNHPLELSTERRIAELSSTSPEVSPLDDESSPIDEPKETRKTVQH